MRSPVDETMRLGSTEILDNALECVVMVTMRSLTEAGQKSESIADIAATDNISIDEFSQELSIGKAHFGSQRKSFGGVLSRT